MSVTDSTIYSDLLQLAKSPGNAVVWSYDITVKVNGVAIKETESQEINAFYDFKTRYYSDMFLFIQVTVSDYQTLMANPQSITVEIVRTLTNPNTGVPGDVKQHYGTYLGYITDPEDTEIMALRHSGKDERAGDSSYMEIILNLIEPYIADYRLADIGGVYKNTTVENLLRCVMGYGLGTSANRVLLESPGYIGLKGVDVVTPDNQRVYQHIVIPNGTRIIHVPKYLQDHYGIYTGGLGWHIFNKICYIYPLLKNTEYAKRHKVLTIVNIPTDEIPTLEKTYTHKDDQLYIFSTGESKYVSVSEKVQLNIGNGFRFTRASDLIDLMEETTMNRSVWDAKLTVKTLLIHARPDERQNIRFVDGRITDNPYKHVSKLVAGLGGFLTVSWTSADPALLYPGMQTKIVYKARGRVQSRMGTLTSVRATTSTGSTKKDAGKSTSCELEIYVQQRPQMA